MIYFDNCSIKNWSSYCNANTVSLLNRPEKCLLNQDFQTHLKSCNTHNGTQSCMNDCTSLHLCVSNPAWCTCWAFLPRFAVQPCCLCAVHLCCSGISHLFSLSLLHLPTPSLCFLLSWPQPPWLSSPPLSLLCFSPFSCVLHAAFNTLPFSSLAPSTHQWPIKELNRHMSVYVNQYMWVGGGYGMNFISRSVNHTHPIWLLLLINDKGSRAGKTRADYTTTGKLSWCLPGYLGCMNAGRDTFEQETSLSAYKPWIAPCRYVEEYYFPTQQRRNGFPEDKGQ